MNKYDDKTTEFLADKNPQLRADLVMGVSMRAEARRLEDQAKALTESANKLLAGALYALEPKEALTFPEFGSITFLQDLTHTSISRDKMEKYLLTHGVPAEMLSMAREHATTTKKQEYQIKFTPLKD